jgi:peroxiredoxin
MISLGVLQMDVDMKVLKPRQPVPELEVDTLQGPWSLSEQTPDNFTMLVFYRGLHCPLCTKYLKELDRLSGDFSEIGVTVLVLSSDDKERALEAQLNWDLQNISLAYGVTTEQAQSWGLHRSAGKGKTSTGIEEPAEFSEPGLFLIRSDRTLYWSQVSTMPFARPLFREVLGALNFVLANNYPARGELV